MTKSLMLEKKIMQTVKRKVSSLKGRIGVGVTVCILFVLNLLIHSTCLAETASWYSRASCLREGTSGMMANGKELDDEKLTCASWMYRFGTILLVTNLSNGKQVKVVVCDRGPNKRLVRKGRIIDLSVAAFAKLAPLSKGIIKVKVEKI